MKLTIYIDVLISVNIIINYIIAKITCIISGSYAETKRMIISSVAGALFSLLILFELSDLFSLFIKIFSIILCCFFTFGYNSRFVFIKNNLCLLVVNIIFSGLIMLMADKSSFIYINNYMYYFTINPVTLVICISILYVFITVCELFFSTPKEVLYDFVVIIAGKEYNLKGFYDTGFGLKDVLNDRAVIMCSFDTIKNMISPSLSKEIYSFHTKGEYHSSDICPLFYGDISCKGMLPAIKADKVYIIRNEKKIEIKNTAIAVCRQSLSEEYRIIFGKQIMKRTGY